MTKKLNIFIRINNAYHEFGFLGFIKKNYYLLTDIFYDKKFNISTQNILDEVNDDMHPESIDYMGARYTQLISVFNKLPIDYNNSTFLDLGCGKGRAIAIAATHPFRKVMGVEYDKELALSAQRNIGKMRFKKMNAIEIYQYNAMNYDIPSEVNIIYMFNPFIGKTLKKVVDNIRYSYENSPRKIYIIFINYGDFDKIIKDQKWINKIVTLPTVDTVSTSLYVTKI